MIKLFDYSFYRIYEYFKGVGDAAPETKGSLLVALVQFFTILDLMVLVRIVYTYPIPSKYYFLPLLITLGIVNWARYERNLSFRDINAKWNGESEKKRIRNGRALGAYFLFAFTIPLIYGAATH
jgi:hypothetical protein